jgi:ABC-type spermidine/putrescine transport system permease subunit I
MTIEQVMKILLVCEAIGFFGITRLQATWKRRGELTETKFALVSIAYWSLLTMTAILTTSTTLNSIFVGSIVGLIWWLLGYPLARWIYRQFFRP